MSAPVPTPTPPAVPVLGTLLVVAVDRPVRTIFSMVLLVLLAAPGLLRLELRTDGHALIPPRDPAIAYDAQVREHFGVRDLIVVHIETEHPDGIYNPTTLGSVAELTETLAALPGVGEENVSSLATEKRDRVYTGTLEFRPFLDPFPDTPERLELVRGDVEAAAILKGTLVSTDDRGTVILVGVPALPAGEEALAAAERGRLYRDVVAVVDARAESPDRVTVVGAPVAESLLGLHILEDLTVLLPLAIGVMALVLGLGCRRFWGVALGFAEIGGCLIFTFGVMGWVGIPVYLPTAVLPVILCTVGLADEIHIFWHYQRRLAESPNSSSASPLDEEAAHVARVRRALGEMARPVALTSLTTALGFLSFLTSPIVPVRTLGLFAALGIVFCLFWSMTFVPAALRLLPASALRRSFGREAHGPGARAATVLTRRRGAVLVGLAVATVITGAGITRLVVQDGWVEGFAPSSPFRKATERVNETFFGTHLLLVTLDLGKDLPEDVEVGPVGRKGPLLSPTYLRLVDGLESMLRDRPEVGGVLGPASHLRTVQYLWLARRSGAHELPQNAYRTQTVIQRFDTARGETLRRRVIDDDLRRVLITVFLEDANYRETAELMARVRSYEAEHLTPLGIELGFAGDVAVSQAMIPAIVETQIGSLLLALITALTAVGLMRQSLRGALLAVGPAAMAVLWVLGGMGWLGVPVGVATSMFCAITLGVGIDFGIHLTERFQLAEREGASSPLAVALGQAGPAILADATAVGLGFGVLVVSQVPANARLGLIVALALGVGCLVCLAGVGAILAQPRQV